METEDKEVLVRFLLSRLAIHKGSATAGDFGRLEELAHILLRIIHHFDDMPYTSKELEDRCIRLLESFIRETPAVITNPWRIPEEPE